MALNFPTGTTLNQLYTSGDRVWLWNGFAWEEKKTFVNTFNGSTGAVGISGGSNVTIVQTGNTYTISSSGGGVTGATGAGIQGATGATGATGAIPTNFVSSYNGLTGAVQGVSAAVGGTGISVSGATGAVTITYNIQSQAYKATPTTDDLVQINDGPLSNRPRNTYIGNLLDIIAGDVAVSNTGASTYSAILTSTKGGFGVNNSAGTNGQILVAKSSTDGDFFAPTQYVVATLGTGTGISTTTGEGTLQINNTGVLNINGLTGAVQYIVDFKRGWFLL